jgi:cyclophilin family peptidyl-prolyl cis-trans isomerase
MFSFRKLSIDEIIYWGTLLFAAVAVGYLLITLIQTAALEDTSFTTEGAYMRKQAKVAIFETSMGEIRVALMRSQAPTTVNNFVSLVQSGFYDNTKFHRIVPGMLIQGGDPLSRESDEELYGTGGPGYVFDDEIRGIKMERGVLAMANLGRPKTNGSQFFIVVAPLAPAMEGKYTIFGKVIAGMEVVDAINKVKTGKKDIPTTPVMVRSIKIERPEGS